MGQYGLEFCSNKKLDPGGPGKSTLVGKLRLIKMLIDNSNIPVIIIYNNNNTKISTSILNML